MGAHGCNYKCHAQTIPNLLLRKRTGSLLQCSQVFRCVFVESNAKACAEPCCVALVLLTEDAVAGGGSLAEGNEQTRDPELLLLMG